MALPWHCRCTDAGWRGCIGEREDLETVAPVRQWTGREAAALRAALRLTVRSFADHLGVAVRTVTKWETLREAVKPRPDYQAILDTALARADRDAQARYELIVLAEGPSNGGYFQTGGRDWDYDLDR